MEMWCLYDIRRDSWDWAACLGESMTKLSRVVWRLLACENGASPDCNVVVVVVVVVVGCWLLVVAVAVVVVVVSETTEARQCLCQQSPVLIGMVSPRWQRTLRHRGLPKLARCVKTAENPSHRHMTASRNNVQIFKCELRREVRVHRHDENM